MFYANDIYTHNSSASNDIIEADGVADSYRKIMTADFIMSISRKKDDKVSNTARFYVVKNRFGSDGHTFPARMDTSTGDIKLFSDKSEEGVEIMNNLKDCEKAQKKQLSCELKDFLDSK
jgi:hypothetical protein